MTDMAGNPNRLPKFSDDPGRVVLPAPPQGCAAGRHGSLVPIPCPHCAEDAKILEEAAAGVVDRFIDLVYAIRTEDATKLQEAASDAHSALRDLIREARR